MIAQLGHIVVDAIYIGICHTLGHRHAETWGYYLWLWGIGR